MTAIDTQVHGYRQGHQLLSSGVTLPKSDQAAIDRLSDVAGPLRPDETFAPYLSAYPLPSGRHYVVARTWQDLTIARAGCVRTLSVVVPMAAWKSVQPGAIIDALDSVAFPQIAEPMMIESGAERKLPSLAKFDGAELLEALFLEDAKPMVLFDAPEPDLLATRLLTAFWPELRASFALSTFALSPRKVEGRFFDLVFAPADARGRFSDWPGRRLDGRAARAARHRWTGAIVRRVFEDPAPRLLNEREVRFADASANPAAGLRIAMLWDELRAGLDTSPNAVLGLLDIIISSKDAQADTYLATVIGEAARRAAGQLPPSDAWDFLAALMRKLGMAQLSAQKPEVASVARALAARSPSSLVPVFHDPERARALEPMMMDVAGGLGEAFGEQVKAVLTQVRADVLVRLVALSPELARGSVAAPALLRRLIETVGELPEVTFSELKSSLLPLLIKEAHVELARPFIASLDERALLDEVLHLAKCTLLSGHSFDEPIVARARALSAVPALRRTLLQLPQAPGRDRVLRGTLAPVVDDVRWLLQASDLNTGQLSTLLLDLLRLFPTDQFAALTRDITLGEEALDAVPDDASDVLFRFAFESGLANVLIVSTVQRLLRTTSGDERTRVARAALHLFLHQSFPGDEAGMLATLLKVLGGDLDGREAVRIGLSSDVSAEIASRNLRAFDAAPKQARRRIVEAAEDLARTLAGRTSLDVDREAARAAARLLWDAQSVAEDTALRAVGSLLPSLMRSKQAPVSALVAVCFPPVYRELARQNDDIPDLLRFIPFFDWDRCKAARRELVEAFVQSDAWDPGDLALVACRSSDVGRFLRRMVKSHGGDVYIRRVADDLEQVPGPCRKKVTLELAKLHIETTAKPD